MVHSYNWFHHTHTYINITNNLDLTTSYQISALEEKIEFLTVEHYLHDGVDEEDDYAHRVERHYNAHATSPLRLVWGCNVTCPTPHGRPHARHGPRLQKERDNIIQKHYHLNHQNVRIQ